MHALHPMTLAFLLLLAGITACGSSDEGPSAPPDTGAVPDEGEASDVAGAPRDVDATADAASDDGPERRDALAPADMARPDDALPDACPYKAACEARECGADPVCGVSCGSCEPGETCSDRGVCEACVPACEGFDCGDDGCGGVCGACIGCEQQEDSSLCREGVCAEPCCPFTCEEVGKDCSAISDGCGGLLECGRCATPDYCGGGGEDNVCGRPAGWDVETVDDEEGAGRFVRVATDDDGAVHAAYVGGDHDGLLRYATGWAGAWILEDVETDGEAGRFADLAIGSDGRPRIAHHRADTDEVRFGVRGTDGWSMERVDDPSPGGRFLSLALGEGDRPHLAYQRTDERVLRYATRTGTGWAVEDVDTESANGFNTAILADTSGPVIAYAARGRLRIATREAAAFTLDDQGRMSAHTGCPMGIAKDNAGRLYVLFHDVGEVLTLATREDGTWTREVVDTADYRCADLLVSPTGEVQVAYLHGYSQQVVLAERGLAGWVKRSIAGAPDATNQHWIAIALREGAPGVLWADPEAGALLFALGSAR